MQKTSLFLLALLFLLSACSDHKEPKDRTTIIGLSVAAETARYPLTGEVPPEMVGQMVEGMQIKESGQTEWRTVHFQTIEGFIYEEDYTYNLKVEKTLLANPPADGPDVRYVLVEVLSKVWDNLLPCEAYERTSRLQSSPGLMLADRVVCRNSSFVLDLSAGEAAELMIPQEMYQSFAAYTEAFNTDAGEPFTANCLSRVGAEQKGTPRFLLKAEIVRQTQKCTVEAVCADLDYSKFLKKNEAAITYRWGIKTDGAPLQWIESDTSILQLEGMEDNTTVYLETVDVLGRKSDLLFLRLWGAGFYDLQFSTLLFNDRDEMYSSQGVLLKYEYTTMPLLPNDFQANSATISPGSALVVNDQGEERKITWNASGHIREILSPAEVERIVSSPVGEIMLYKLVLLNYAQEIVQESPLVVMHSHE